MPSITGSLIAAGVGAAGSIAGGLINSSATKSAANTEANAADNAANTQLQIYNQTQQNLSPYLSTGTSALSQLAGLLGIGGNAPNTSALSSALQNYPGYQFTLQQGLDANAQSEAARGLLNSGANTKNATAYGQGLASSQLGNYLSQLSSVASLGESAGSITGNIGASTGSQVGNSLIQGGSAAGAGQLGSALALTGGVNGALNNSALTLALNGNSAGANAASNWGNYTGDFSEFGM